MYSLRSIECDEVGARAAICARGPVVATFCLDADRWIAFGAFYGSNPTGTLTAYDMGTHQKEKD